MVSLRGDLGQKQSALDITETKATHAKECLERAEAKEMELRSTIEAKEAELQKLSEDVNDLREILVRFELLLARKNMLERLVAARKRPSPTSQGGSAGKKKAKTT